MNTTIKSAFGAIALVVAGAASAQTTLLNVSYDVAREFYKDLNAAFVAQHKKTTGKDIKVDQSHAGSSAQARAVADGLEADVAQGADAVLCGLGFQLARRLDVGHEGDVDEAAQGTRAQGSGLRNHR